MMVMIISFEWCILGCREPKVRFNLCPQVFVDDEVVYEARDISLRVKYSVMIVGMFFHTLSLGAHDSDLGATQSCYMYYRNFFFSRDRKPPPLRAS